MGKKLPIVRSFYSEPERGKAQFKITTERNYQFRVKGTQG